MVCDLILYMISVLLIHFVISKLPGIQFVVVWLSLPLYIIIRYSEASQQHVCTNSRSICLLVTVILDVTRMSISLFFVLLAAFVEASASLNCFNQSRQLIENFTLENCCYLYNEFRCIALEYLEVGCIRTGMCMTYDDVNSLRAGFCPYHPPNATFCHKPLKDYYKVRLSTTLTDLNRIICDPYNREGVLCSQCKPGYGPAVYAFSLMCVECSDNGTGWILYFFLVLFPITVFYLILIIFNVRATSPPFAAFVFLCQTFSNIDRVHVPLATRLAHYPDTCFQILVHVVRVLCGIWNLDFFRHLVPPFCVSSHLSNIQALSLEFVGIIYSLVLVLVTYVCVELHARNFKLVVFAWKPFHKCFIRIRKTWDPKASILNSFSTMVLIYISKLIFVANLSLLSTKVYGIRHHKHFIYFDSSIRLFSKQHLPYVILSVIATSFVIIFSLLLLFYPTKLFRKLLEHCLPLQWRLALHAFVETFHGHYKDGTNGTKDYRAIAGLQFCLQVIVISGYLNSRVRFYFITYLHISLAAISLLYAITQPCKMNSDNYLLCTLFTLTICTVQTIFLDSIHSLLAMSLLLLSPHCLFIIVNIAQKVWNNCYCFRKPFVYLSHNNIVWTKRRQKEAQDLTDNFRSTRHTESTRLLLNTS